MAESGNSVLRIVRMTESQCQGLAARNVTVYWWHRLIAGASVTAVDHLLPWRATGLIASRVVVVPSTGEAMWLARRFSVNFKMTKTIRDTREKSRRM